jgi:hypothetical protein
MEPAGKITVTRKRALKVGDLRVLQLSESSLDPLYLVRSLLPLTRGTIITVSCMLDYYHHADHWY